MTFWIKFLMLCISPEPKNSVVTARIQFKEASEVAKHTIDLWKGKLALISQGQCTCSETDTDNFFSSASRFLQYTHEEQH